MWCSGVSKTNEVDILREHLQHRIRLHTIKSRINTNPPKSMPHLKKKLKGESQKQEKNTYIQTENQLLLQKIYDIDARAPEMKRSSSIVSNKSLNKDFRVKNLTKITEENQGILSRLQGTKSVYSFKSFDKNFQYQQYLSYKVSENSRRVPRLNNFTMVSALNTSGTTHSRPGTASEGNFRPITGHNSRKNINLL